MVANLSRDDARDAIEAAQAAFKTYKKVPHRERRWLMRKWADLLKANKEDLAAICTLELGKPYIESFVTVKYATDFLDWFEGETERTYGETIPAARGDNRIFTIREPQGVVAAITPWNSPIAMVMRKIGAAIATGNTVVLKPAPETPLCARAVAKLFERAGYPPGVLNVVTSDIKHTPEIGDEFCFNNAVRHLSFTGSTAVGKMLNSECAKSLKKTSMELGGNGPFIVFEDANLEKAVNGEWDHILRGPKTNTTAGLISSKFRSSGQTCVCANRILIHRSIMNAFAERLKVRLEETFKHGSVWDTKVSFGPLYGPKAIEKVERHVKDATSKGAKVFLGGHINQVLGPNFYVPTILTDTTTEMLFFKGDTFGPVAPLTPFDTEEEAIRIANDTNAGLAAYFYTEDISRLWRVSEALQAGMVGCRVGLVSACEQPFGGMKESGIGREGSRFALDEYVNIKSITLGV